MPETQSAIPPMNCDTAQEMLAAKLAVEISDAQHQHLVHHLTGCAECRMTERQWQSDDRMLNRAFGAKKYVAQAVASSVMQQVHTEVSGKSDSALMNSSETLPDHTPGQVSALDATVKISPRREPGKTFLTVALAVAVGFLMAAVSIQPLLPDANTIVVNESKSGRRPAAASGGTPAMAQLVASTGPIRCRPSIANDWVSIKEAQRFVCEPATEIETGPNSRCEIVTVDGCILRLNTNTRLVVETGRRVRVTQGQIWCRSSADQPMEVVVDSGEHAANGDLPIYECPFGSVCMLKVTAPALRAQAADGQITMVTSKGSRVIDPGQSIMMTSTGKITADFKSNPLLTSSWMDALLIRKSHSDPDLKLRVESLLNKIGESNLTREDNSVVSLQYERQLRNLGEHCVMPLTEYVQSAESHQTPLRRRRAMALVSDMSPTWNVSRLIELVDDDDDQVKTLAAQALRRLTGESDGQLTHEWSEQPTALDGARDTWQDWWNSNRERFLLMGPHDHSL